MVTDDALISLIKIISYEKKMTTLEQRPLPQRPPCHRSRMRRRKQISVAAATTCLVSTAAAAVLSWKLPSALASKGGYLAYPQSRNYIAYKTSSIVPSATHPASLLAEEEPTPQNVNSGQRCGVTDASKRDYNRPMSREKSLLPLNIQEVYVSGSEIEVTVNLFGVKDGGHFEFHICALEYPEEPTEDCFKKHPLTFVKDIYYGATSDEFYPERAYVPFEQAFDKTGNSMTRVESEADGLGDMMEFKYTFKLPESTDLKTDFEVINSISIADVDSSKNGDGEILPAMTTTLTDQVIEAIDKKYASFDGKTYSSGSTGSNAVLISAMVTNGEGTTTIVSINEVPTIHENGPIVEAIAICTFGEKSIYGLGVTNIPEKINRICGVKEESPLEASQALGDVDTDSNGDVPSDLAESISSFPPIRYALLRWHYQTARDCFHPGYEEYAWPEEWGPWQKQRGGECYDDESQDEYWNCAEVLILNPVETANEEPPTAVKDIFIVDVNQEVQLDVLANDINPDEGDSLHVGSATSPIHGILELSENGSAVVYIPDEDYIGLDSFEYRCCDKHNSCSDAAKVDIQVGPTMDFVFAKDDEATTTGTEPVFINVLDNDIVRLDNWPLFVVGMPRDGRHGKCTVTPDSWMLYKANPGYEGRDRCSYKACITTDICDTGVIYIDVKSTVGEDDVTISSTSPTSVYNIVAVNDGAVTHVNQPIKIDVLANDEVNGNVKPKVKYSNGANNGNCQVSRNKVVYTPKLGFSGWDRCDYTACLGTDLCDKALVKIKVIGDTVPEGDTLPAIRPDNASVVEGTSVNIDVLQNDDNPDGDALVVSSVSSPLHGSVEILNNLLRYTSITGFTGTDSFTYSACDRANHCDSAGVVVTVIAEVLAKDDSATTISAPILIDVTANDRSSSGKSSLVVTDVKDGKHGSCSITASNKVKYIPDGGYSGLDRFNYVVCDGSACDQGRVEVNVLPTVQSMQEVSFQIDLEKVYAKDDHIVAFLDESITVDVVSNDFVKGMGPLIITHTGGSKNGKCEITHDNEILYTPKDGFRGSDTCEYTICHESNMCDEGILRIDVIQEKILRSSLTLSAEKASTLTRNDSSSADRTIFIPASADATITTEFPAGNFGDATTLFVSSASSSAGLRDTMMKFHTSSIHESSCENGFESASVSVYSLAYASDGGTLITTSDNVWAEMEVTWNDAPVGDGIVIKDMGTIEVNTWYDIDVSSAMTLGDPLSIRIISHAGGESIALYASRNHSDETLHPVLKIRC